MWLKLPSIQRHYLQVTVRVQLQIVNLKSCTLPTANLQNHFNLTLHCPQIFIILLIKHARVLWRWQFKLVNQVFSDRLTIFSISFLEILWMGGNLWTCVLGECVCALKLGCLLFCLLSDEFWLVLDSYFLCLFWHCLKYHMRLLMFFVDWGDDLGFL